MPKVIGPVNCPYCLRLAKLVTGKVIYPNRPDLHKHRFWQCAPCDAWVGVHAASKAAHPLGRLANAELRKAKMAAHAAFDPWWRSRGMRRTAAYRDLAERMGMEKSKAHIGKMDVSDCARVVAIYGGVTT